MICPIELTAKAKIPELVKLRNIITNFSNFVMGVISPYPMLTIVIKEKYKLSRYIS